MATDPTPPVPVSPPTEPPAPDTDRVYRILSIDGGGYLGLGTAALIEAIERDTQVSFAERFDLFCGTSTGAILALGLATGRSGAQLRKLYEGLGSSVFNRPRTGGGYFRRARYSNNSLRTALEREFRTDTAPKGLVLDDLLARKKYVLATAFNLTTGKPRVFKTKHSPRLKLHGRVPLADVALASSAAPYYFPAVTVTDPQTGVRELYCDGGVVANHPALLGFAEAVAELGWAPGRLKILSLSTPAVEFGEGVATLDSGDRGLASWGAKLASMFLEAGAAIADETMKRFLSALPSSGRPKYERVEMKNMGNYGIDCASAEATQAHINEGERLASNQEIRDRVSSILS